MPPRPRVGGALEETARDVRYHGLFLSMQQSKLNTIAMGHHLDDQAETLLMNFNRGSRSLGLAGMRRCRRWGMGTQKPGSMCTFFGLEGMRSWVIRPLLSIPKVRFLISGDLFLLLSFVMLETNHRDLRAPPVAIRRRFD
jgi:tRNA(Ile)-lysidine synthase TilS/MesJ